MNEEILLYLNGGYFLYTSHELLIYENRVVVKHEIKTPWLLNILSLGLLKILNRAYSVEKTIYICDITSINLNKKMKNHGTINLTVAGGGDNIVFKKEQIAEAEKIIRYLNNKIKTLKTNDSNITLVAGEIRMLKELYDEGIISKDEYEAKKRQ